MPKFVFLFYTAQNTGQLRGHRFEIDHLPDYDALESFLTPIVFMGAPPPPPPPDHSDDDDGEVINPGQPTTAAAGQVPRHCFFYYVNYHEQNSRILRSQPNFQTFKALVAAIYATPY